MTLHEIIASIAAIGSTKAKQEILENNKNNNLLKLAFLYAENPRFNFYVKSTQFPKLHGKNDLSEATFRMLDRLVAREVTGNAARELILYTMESLTEEAQTVLARIINKDLRCNCGTAIANKVWKNLIPEYPMMLASKGDEKAMTFLKKYEGKSGLIVQKKMDGGRVNVFVSDTGEVAYRSRSGNLLNLYGVFDDVFAKFKGMVFDGELLVKSKSGVADRATGNGYYTKAVRGTLSAAEAANFSVEVWDMFAASAMTTGVDKTPYVDRLTDLVAAKFSGKVNVVESETVSTLEECMAFYSRMRAQGEEGAIIKVAAGIWEDKRSKFMVKLKAVETADLLCVGVEKGTGKFADMIGNLICETRDSMLRVNVGTGFNDEQRKQPHDFYIGKICEIEYNAVIASKDAKRDTKSLFLPVFKQVRYDKKVANMLDELK